MKNHKRQDMLEKFLRKRIEQNKKLFKKEELKLIERNTKIIKKYTY